MGKKKSNGSLFVIFLFVIICAFSIDGKSDNLSVLLLMIGGYGAFVTGGLWISDNFFK